MRISALVTARGREPGHVAPPAPPDPGGGEAKLVPPLQLAMERRRAALLAQCPELLGTNASLRDANPRSAMDWLLELLHEHATDLGGGWGDLQQICLAHSTIDANVFHAPAARIKHELGARRAVPYAVGQCQSLAFFHGLELLSAWAGSLAPGEETGARALLAAVEKRRAPLPSHMSRGNPISDGVAAAVLRFDAGPGLTLVSLDIADPLLASEAEGFHHAIDEGDPAHADALARRLWQSLRAAPDALCAGPRLRGALHSQVRERLTLLSQGRALSLEADAQFFMASDPLVALQEADAINRDGLPLLLWTIDDRLSLAAARFTGRLSGSAA